MKPKVERSRKETTLLIIALMAAAVGATALDDYITTTSRAEQQLMSEYLQKHQCVVADVRGRGVASYRCDKPTPGTYVSGVDARQQALRNE